MPRFGIRCHRRSVVILHEVSVPIEVRRGQNRATAIIGECLALNQCPDFSSLLGRVATVTIPV